MAYSLQPLPLLAALVAHPRTPSDVPVARARTFIEWTWRLHRRSYRAGIAQSADLQRTRRGTPGEWLVTMLQAFNQGDIAAFEKVSAESAAAINQQPALVGNAQRLREKIRIFALLEQLRDIPADCRTVAFSVCVCARARACACMCVYPWLCAPVGERRA
jgi:hypothetical protein